MKIYTLKQFFLILGSLSIFQTLHNGPSFAQTAKEANISTNQQSQNEAEYNYLANRLIQTFYTYLANTGSPTGVIGKPIIDDSEARNKVKTLLDQNVILQRADGDFFDYSSYYPIDIDKFSVSNVTTTRPRADLIVATYDIRTPEATSLTRGFISSSEFTPRLTTFRYNPKTKRWLILSHASFNQPIKQICYQPLIKETSNTQPYEDDPSLHRLANTLIDKFYTDLRIHGSAEIHKGGLIAKYTQIMSADGKRRRGAESRSVQLGTTKTRGFIVKGSGNDLVVRYELKTNSHIGGVDFTDEWQPRLATFSKNSIGQWELASFANFNYPASPPSYIQCTGIDAKKRVFN